MGLHMGEKLTESITVKVAPELLRVVRLRAEQLHFDGVGEYIRSLLDSDLQAALADYQALAAIFDQAGAFAQGNLGNRGISENMGVGND
ncbi:Uncharacterised protein [uncultured Comamonas sp.]|nr:Uncharacterised protein [uncultured Comamonas sp.]